MRTQWLAVVFLAAASVPAAAQAPRITPACDCVCLEGYVDKYLDAMLANEVNPKLFARDVKFTENGVRLPLGNEGLWFGMSGRGRYEFYIPDVETQQVAFLGTVMENSRNRGANDGQGNLVAMAVRLKSSVASSPRSSSWRCVPTPGLPAALVRVAPAPGREARVQAAQRRRPGLPRAGCRSCCWGCPCGWCGPRRGAGGAAPAAGGRGAGGGFPPTGEAVEAMKEPHPVYRAVIPEAKRPSREDLIETANYYFTGLARNDGRATPVHARLRTLRERHFDDTDQLQAAVREHASRHRLRIRDRRFVAVDRERGSCSRSPSSITRTSTGPGSWPSCSRSKTGRSVASKRSSIARRMALPQAGAPSNRPCQNPSRACANL